MSLPDASTDEVSPSRNKSSDETIKLSANAEDSIRIEQMEVGSESQDRYQGFFQWLRSTDDCPEMRALNGFILYHAEICDIPFLDEKSIDEFIKDFDFAGSKRGGKSVIKSLMKHCENKMKRLSVKSEETDSDGREVAGEGQKDQIIEGDLGKSVIKTLVEQCENKMKTVCVKSEETDSDDRQVAVGESKDQNIEEDQQSFLNRVMKSWLDIWIKNFNPYMEYIVAYVGTSMDLVERSKRVEFDKEWVERRANELDLFLEKLRVMKRRAKSVRETLGSSSRVEDPVLVEKIASRK